MSKRTILFRQTVILTVASLFLSGCATGAVVKHYRGPEGYDYRPQGQGSIFIESNALSPAFCVRTESMEAGTCLMIRNYSNRGRQFHSILSGRSDLDIQKVELMFYPDGDDMMAYMKARYVSEPSGFDPTGGVTDIHAGPLRTEVIDMGSASLEETGPHGFKVNVGLADDAVQSGKATAKAAALAPVTLAMDAAFTVAAIVVMFLYIMTA